MAPGVLLHKDMMTMGLQSTSGKRKLNDEMLVESSKKLMCNTEKNIQCLTKLNGFEQYDAEESWRYQQHTNRFEEEGRSYLEIGSCQTNSKPNGILESISRNCMLPGTRTEMYSNERLEVLNISMWKLNRFRYPGPGCHSEVSLHKSVLICNTLRLIEREMEQEGVRIRDDTAPFVTPQTDLLPSDSPRHPGPSYEESTDDTQINWSSVLSLSTQSDLGDEDSLMPLSADDVLRSCPGDKDDMFMRAVVGI